MVVSDAKLKLKRCVSRVLELAQILQSDTEFTMITYVAIIGGKAVLTFRAVDDDQAHAMIDDQEGSVRSDLKVLVTGNRYGTGSPPFRCERRQRHNMPNGNGLASKQLSTGKLTWMLATIQTSGTSTYWALPERTKFSAKTSIRPEKSRGNRFKASKQANRNFYKVEKWTRDGHESRWSVVRQAAVSTGRGVARSTLPIILFSSLARELA